MKPLSLRLLLLFHVSFIGGKPNTSPQYLYIQLTKSLSINALLTEYHLDKDECSVQQFLKMNQLKKVELLEKGGKYALPILLFAFDGKTIRSSVGIQNIDLAKRVQAYNTELFRDKIRAKSYQENKVLWVPYSWLHCKEWSAKSKKKNTFKSPNASVSGPETPQKANIYKIFGKRYEEVPIQDSSLQGKIFYIESGHGGPDPGALYKREGRTICEDEYAYDVALRVARNLIAKGATVFLITRDPDDGIRDGVMLTCDADELTYPNKHIPTAHKPRLYQRSDAINELYDKYEKQGVKDQRVMVLHVDSRVKTLQTDIFLYYQAGNKTSQALSENVLESLKKHRKTAYHGSLNHRDLHMLREVKAPVVYVELGNFRNTVDLERIRTGQHRQEVANWLSEGWSK